MLEELRRNLNNDLEILLKRLSRDRDRNLETMLKRISRDRDRKVLAGAIGAVDSQGVPRPIQAYHVDADYHATYDQGLARTGTKERLQRRERFYNLTQLFLDVEPLEGAVAECGCWKGLSAYLLCEAQRSTRPEFQGEGFHLIDSFQGLSEPCDQDVVEVDIVISGEQLFGRPSKRAGSFAATRESVVETLSDYPDVAFHEGWIPEVLDTLPEQSYRFVHVDLDLFEATRACFEYFYPRLVPGGVIICDDYGSLLFPGASKAVDGFAAEQGLRPLVLSTGQAILRGR